MHGRVQAAPRVLLIEPEAEVRHARARKLLASGYRVSAVADTETAPAAFPPHLYDVIIVSANHAPSVPLGWCERVSRVGSEPAIVVVADRLFSLSSTFLPAMVIAETTETAIEEKLLAFLDSATYAQEERA